jgi:hypothetical protein
MESPINSNSLKLQAPNSFATKKFELGAVSRTMGNKETGGRFAPTAIRLRALRRSSAYPERRDFAKFIGITYPNLSNLENGFPISRAVENLVIAKMPWISAEWLIRGNDQFLSPVVAQRLAPLVAEESDTTLPRSRSRAKSGR